MKRFLSIAVAIAIGTSVVVAQAPDAKPGAEHKRMGYFAGQWTYEGEAKPSPMGKGGKITGNESCEWFAGGFQLVCRTKGTNPKGAVTSQAVMAYDPARKAYTYYAISSQGDNLFIRGQVDGKVWTWTEETMVEDVSPEGVETDVTVTETEVTEDEMTEDEMAALEEAPTPEQAYEERLTEREMLREVALNAELTDRDMTVALSGRQDDYDRCWLDVQAAAYGDNRGCDALHDACDARDLLACNDLYWSSEPGSEYEDFGATCGGRADLLDPAGAGFCERLG